MFSRVLRLTLTFPKCQQEKETGHYFQPNISFILFCSFKRVKKYLFIYYIFISVKESGCVKLCQFVCYSLFQCLLAIWETYRCVSVLLKTHPPAKFCKILGYRYAFSLLLVSEILWETPELCADEVIPPALSPRPSR